MFQIISRPRLFTLSSRWPGGEGGVRGADHTVRGVAHLTLPHPSLPRKRRKVRKGAGPLPLSPEGRRRALARGLARAER